MIAARCAFGFLSVVYFFEIVQVDAFEFNGALDTNPDAILHHQSG